MSPAESNFAEDVGAGFTNGNAPALSLSRRGAGRCLGQRKGQLRNSGLWAFLAENGLEEPPVDRSK